MRRFIVILIILFLMIFNISCSNSVESENNVEEIVNSYSGEANAENEVRDIQYEIYIGKDKYSLDDLINIEKLRNLDEYELSLIRNAIYAKYGYKFKSPEYRDYFSKLEWYKPAFDDVSNMLTDLDIQNIDNIVKIEKSDIAIDNNINSDVYIESSFDIVEMKPLSNEYTDFIKEKHEDHDILYYIKEDIDLDGKDEVIIASGIAEENVTSTYISYVYVLRENNGKIQQIGENLAQGGYGVYEIKLIHLQNKAKKYIYCGITNDGPLTGLAIYEVSGNEVNTICYSASATGSGTDGLRDFDNDGWFDGYVQNRSSYDVLYYSLSRTYVLEDNDFILKQTYVEIPPYPTDIKDMLIQYLCLRVLSDEKSPEVDQRLSELCIYDKADDIDISYNMWYPALFNTITSMDDTIEFVIEESNDVATAIVRYSEDNKIGMKLTFHLSKVDNKWCIDSIN